MTTSRTKPRGLALAALGTSAAMLASACSTTAPTGSGSTLRAQVFTGDALSHVAFTGSLAALAFGIDLRVGLFASCALIAVLFGALGRRGRADDVVIGNVFAWVLGLGLSSSEAVTALVIGLCVSIAMLLIARPLLFATLDEAVAGARGVPVRFLSYAFLVLIGITAGEASQAVGSMLLLGLLVAPAGTALLLTDRPFVGMAISAGLGVLDVWLGLTRSHFVPDAQASFWIMAVAAAFYAAAMGHSRISRSRRRAPVPVTAPYELALSDRSAS
jgi:zinc/manganese transport system permease protein